MNSADAESAAPEYEAPPVNADVMYRVMSGEVLGADGLTSEAAYEYLEAAMNSEDPAIAARATRIALAAQEFQLAAMAADRWALLKPDSIDARQTAARTMLVVGDYAGAEHQLSELLVIMQHDLARAWSLVADILSNGANPEKTGQLVNNLVEIHDAERVPDAIFARSVIAGRGGELQRSMTLADEALAIDPSRADIHAWSGRLAVNLDQQDKALGHYRAAWELRPADRRIVMAYAELLRRNDQSDEAQEALATLDDSPETRFARIAFALDSNHQDLAVELYREFELAGYSDGDEAAFQAAQAAELLGLSDEAIGWYANVSGGPRLLVASLRRAYLTADNGDVDGARRLLSELRDSEGNEFRSESFIAESEILVNAGRPEEALGLLQQTVREHQPDTRLLYSRAMLSVQLEKLDDAERDLRRIIEIEPDNATALNALGYTLADRTDRFEEAARLIEAAYELEPEESSVIDSMGWVAFRLGRMDEAERYLRDAWSRDRNAEIGAHLGEVLWVNERYDEAREIWTDALQVDPQNAVLTETLERFGVDL
ncbi:MAG: tetratricopeptide repeat protein [Xanthomonadales bacterium]|nr:tetratricopeptide repeat protein [Xanthomonadales bacterium]NNL95905.1 tetratricopeptide repeat protein [Xanthomonadales bacterium]